MIRALLVPLLLLLAFTPLRAGQADAPYFQFDPADESVTATLLENPLAYDAGVAPGPEGLWVAWLELQPGKGDHLWIGRRSDNRWLLKKQLSSEPGDYSHPTPTLDAQGKLWLTYESDRGSNWDVFVQQHLGNDQFSAPQRLSASAGSDISHHVAADRQGGFWLVWQSDRNGQFDILARHLAAGKTSDPIVIADSARNDWAPSATVTPDGALHVVWDSYDGRSYNVLQRTMREGKLGAVRTIAGTPAFEAHAQIASDRNGNLWIAWEEDGENWGKAYRPREAGQKKSTRMADHLGPLHRFRKLHLAELDEKTSQLREYVLPMPSLALAQARPNPPDGLKSFGARYEGTRLAIDGLDRLWLVYRHIYPPRFGISAETHQQENIRLYARCLLPGGWSKLFSFAQGQGDGLQRIFVAPQPEGIQTAWTTGRTDRRKIDQSHGVALASLRLTDARVAVTRRTETATLAPDRGPPIPAPHARPATAVGGRKYEVFFGDLHRHTDISLCMASGDGSIDDAYRYAIDAAPLDFLGITDHTHDIAMGDPLSLIWWRSRKEVSRHQLGTTFFSFFAYERSRGDTDHNVVSLRDDILRPHTYPLPQFWQELDGDTITIPHQPFNRAFLWQHKDDVHRPLLEIFQGFRNQAHEPHAHEGLKKGHRVGFIASSDHLSTGASFAGVWAEKPERESIFRALQARRTYGATAKIVLKVTCGDHWMGEAFSAKSMPLIRIEVAPTAPLEKIELMKNGAVEASLKGAGRADGLQQYSFNVPPVAAGEHIFYLRLTQSDGNMAWSSPLWITIDP